MVNILGINLSEFRQAEVLKKIADFLLDGRQHYIVTPNPEIILTANNDEEFFYILNKADLSLADGFGLKIAGWFFGHNLPRVTGADITVDLLKMAAEKKIKVMILNWEKGLSKAEEIEAALKQKFPELIFSVLDISRDKFLTPEKITAINNFAPAILFNTLGFPYQEKLMYHNLSELTAVKVALGIGGSFDYITGKINRGPKIFRHLGLEWFWRLLNVFKYQDSARRIHRIYRATFVFFKRVLTVRFINQYFYRKNVACFLFKREEGKIKVLILERRDEAHHWQLPQGGTDGESLEIAGGRELLEETGLKNLRTVAVFKNLYKYSFPKITDSEERFRGSRRYTYDYKGQKQGLYIAELTDTTQEVKVCFWDHINFKWVDADDLVNNLHPYRQPGAKIFLAKFKSLNIS